MNTFIAEIKIVLRDSILDVQGKAIESSLHSLEFKQLSNVRVGKIITLNVTADSSDEASAIIRQAANKLLANPIIEDFSITIN